jgi:hypothetical protein
VWEGIAQEVAAKEIIETPFQAPAHSGQYRLNYFVNASCDPGMSLIQAGCKIEDIPSMTEFEVERELCEVSEHACQFTPAAPNYLCDDGVSLGGPANQCTREPSTGECGYELLSCP